MSLIERLEQAAKEQNAKVAAALSRGAYNQQAADYRELLQEAASALKGPPLMKYENRDNTLNDQDFSRGEGYITYGQLDNPSGLPRTFIVCGARCP